MKVKVTRRQMTADDMVRYQMGLYDHLIESHGRTEREAAESVVRDMAKLAGFPQPRHKDIKPGVFAEAGRRGALVKWANTDDRSAATSAARESFQARFSTPEERREYYAELGRKSVASRRARRTEREAVIAGLENLVDGITRIEEA